MPRGHPWPSRLPANRAGFATAAVDTQAAPCELVMQGGGSSDRINVRWEANVPGIDEAIPKLAAAQNKTVRCEGPCHRSGSDLTAVLRSKARRFSSGSWRRY